jgi:alpha-tubulin suppressor-like RCC1 family protein
VPATVQNLGAVTSISVGDRHTCATSADGLVRCWGDNQDGRLGDGTLWSTSALAVVGLP